MTSTAEIVLASLQCGLLAPLAVLGLHRGYMVWLYLRTRSRVAPTPPQPADDAWPTATIQLPIYNERHVAARLLRCVAEADYPHDRLTIQVLDDSTDDTSDIVRAMLAELPAELRVRHIRRGDRTGFKAGALAAGLREDESEFVAVFDADFLPPRDFLRRTLPHLLAAERVGMVQARWGHLNPDYSVLTDIQRTLLDGHFLVEHCARSRANCFFNFNGTAGVFRRACIDDAGGWKHDTLTEDMDLSYRAQLRAWRFVYLPDLVCPAELPIEMNAFLSQQHRWAKGSIQTARKLLGRVLRAPIPVLAKLEACFHLLGNVAFPLLLGLILVGLPLQLVRASSPTGLPGWVSALEATPLLFATFCLFVYYGTARIGAGTLRTSAVLRLPLVFAIGAGMCVNNTIAVCTAMRRDPGEFLRTPKRDVIDRHRPLAPSNYASRRGLAPFAECALALWALATSVTAFWIGNPGTGIFHGLFAIGLGWTGLASIREDRQRARPRRVADPANEVLAVNP